MLFRHLHFSRDFLMQTLFMGSAIAMVLCSLFVYSTTNNMERIVREQSTIDIHLLSRATDNSIHTLATLLQGNPAVSSVVFLSKTQRQAQLESASVLLADPLVRSNFNDVLRIHLSSPQAYGDILALLSNEQWNRTIDTRTLSLLLQRKEYVLSLSSMTSISKAVGYAFALLSLATLVFAFVFLKKAGLYSRRQLATLRTLGFHKNYLHAIATLQYLLFCGVSICIGSVLSITIQSTVHKIARIDTTSFLSLALPTLHTTSALWISMCVVVALAASQIHTIRQCSLLR